MLAGEAGFCAGDPVCLSEVSERLGAFVDEESLALEGPVAEAELPCLRRAGIAFLAGLDGYGRVADAGSAGDFETAGFEVGSAQDDLDRSVESLGECRQEALEPG